MTNNKTQKNNPHPIKLGIYKAPLQKYAVEQERSLHNVVIIAVKEFCEKHSLIKK